MLAWIADIQNTGCAGSFDHPWPLASGIPPAIPRQSLPGQALPGQALPGQALPGQALPGQALPGQALPE